MPAASPFRIPNIPRAPRAPMQRSIFGPARQPRSGGQEGPFAPVTALGSEAGPGPGGTSPPSPFFPVSPLSEESFANLPYDPRRAATLTRQFQAENRIGARVALDRPVVGTLPQVGPGPERETGMYEYYLYGRRYLTNIPGKQQVSAGPLAADGTQPTVEVNATPVMETNPAFTRAFATLSPQERDIFAGQQFVDTGEGEPGTTVEDVPGLPGYKWTITTDEFGNRKPGTPFIPRNLEEERGKEEQARRKAELREENAAEERAADRRQKKREFDYQVALNDYNYKLKLAEIYGKRQAERGGFAAQAAQFAPATQEAASERAFQEAVRGGFAGTGFTSAATPSPSTVARGYDPNAPGGSPANPYGNFTPYALRDDQKTAFSGAPRQGDPALAQNMLNAQQANNQVMAARTRQALYPAAQNAIKLLQGNPQALRDDQKAALLRDLAPLFEAGVEEAQGLDLGVLWAALQPLRGFGFARPQTAIFAGRR